MGKKLALVAALFTVLALLPQLFSVANATSLTGLSLPTFVIIAIASFLNAKVQQSYDNIFGMFASCVSFAAAVLIAGTIAMTN